MMPLEHTQYLYTLFLKCTGPCTDTRLLQPGNMFFALRGDNFNGNTYAEKAIRDGALFAIIDDPQFHSSDQCVLVDNVLETLQVLARHHRQQFDIPFLAITGSNGKTTTKELMHRVLSQKYLVHATAGNLNNHIGVPLTLLTMPIGTELVIVEMGANHLGDIAFLCAIAQPTHGLITNIGRAHIGEFGSFDNIVRGKSELFDFLRKSDGVPFINQNDPILANMSKRFENGVSYPNSDCTFAQAKPFVTYVDHADHTHVTQLIGEYNFVNIAAAVTVGLYFGVDNPYIALDQFAPDNNRSQILHLRSNVVILDAYNANPTSMMAALQNLANMPQKNKIAMLGDMKELGQYSLDEHARIVAFAKTSCDLQILYVVGEEFSRVEQSNAYANVGDLVLDLSPDLFADTAILIKGSRSMRMEKLVEALK